MTLQWSKWPNFARHEFACKGKNCCGGRADMDPVFMDALQGLRTTLGFPLVISSGYRCLEYDQSIGGAGPHRTGKAADVRIYGARARDLIRHADAFTGIGFDQRLSIPHAKRFIHLDTLDGPARPGLWGYP